MDQQQRSQPGLSHLVTNSTGLLLQLSTWTPSYPRARTRVQDDDVMPDCSAFQKHRREDPKKLARGPTACAPSLLPATTWSCNDPGCANEYKLQRRRSVTICQGCAVPAFRSRPVGLPGRSSRGVAVASAVRRALGPLLVIAPDARMIGCVRLGFQHSHCSLHHTHWSRFSSSSARAPIFARVIIPMNSPPLRSYKGRGQGHARATGNV